MRRQFQLPTSEEEHVNARGQPWETIVENGVHWLLFHEMETPVGYNHEKVTAAVRIEPGYPDTALDMVYFYPHLARKDGKPINALSLQQIDGKSFQRWSRHRTRNNSWRPGVDDLASHLILVEEWLKREFAGG